MESPAAHELMKSQGCLTQLVSLLNNKNASEEKLAVEAMAAISKALSLLQDAGRTEDARQRSPSRCSYEATSVVNSAPKGKLKPPNKAAKRRCHPYMCSLLSKTLDDGFSWRKYGQKDIQSQSNRPRSYYRCTHKPRGCQAIRQVQRSPEHPSSYAITYIGQHTCKDSRLNPFSSTGGVSLAPPPAASTLVLMPKQESDHDTSSTLSHQLQLDADWEDVKSVFGSSISLDIDSMVDSFLVDQISCSDHDVFFSI